MNEYVVTLFLSYAAVSHFVNTKLAIPFETLTLSKEEIAELQRNRPQLKDVQKQNERKEGTAK